jgi:hypothetical protein
MFCGTRDNVHQIRIRPQLYKDFRGLGGTAFEDERFRAKVEAGFSGSSFLLAEASVSISIKELFTSFCLLGPQLLRLKAKISGTCLSTT